MRAGVRQKTRQFGVCIQRTWRAPIASGDVHRAKITTTVVNGARTLTSPVTTPHIELIGRISLRHKHRAPGSRPRPFPKKKNPPLLTCPEPFAYRTLTLASSALRVNRLRSQCSNRVPHRPHEPARRRIDRTFISTVGTYSGM